MDVINVGETSYERLVYFYMVDRLMNYPVKSYRKWLQDCTNAVEWCGSGPGFDKFTYHFECHYLAALAKLTLQFEREFES